LDVHPVEDLLEGRRETDGERPAAGAGALGAALDADAGALERAAEEARRLGRARGSERGQRPRRLAEEGRLPARRAAPPVEPRLVGDEGAGDATEAAGAQVAREGGEARPVERRVAAALQDEVADPGCALGMPLAEHVGAHPERRPERDERGVGERELLVRGGYVRVVGVV